MKMKTRLLALTAGGLMAFVLERPALSGEQPAPPPGKESVSEKNNLPLMDKLSALLTPSPQLEAYRCDDMHGRAVQGADRSKLGEFQNWLIDLPQGRIVVGEISTGGLLGIGETLRAIPASIFRYNEMNHTFALNTDKRTFHRCPAFNEKHVNDVGQLVVSYRQFAQEPYWSAGGTRQAVRENEKAAGNPAASPAPSNLKKSSQMIGSTARDPSQQELGEICDFVLDLKSGRVLYAVLAQGGILGVGDKLYPIPPQAFGVSEAGKALVLNTTREQLARAPQFTKDSWPVLSDPKWASDVYIYYHAPMYWLPPRPEMNKGATELMRQPVRQAEEKAAHLGTTASPLAGKVMEAIKADSALAPLTSQIQITEEGSQVTLSGVVGTDQQKEALAKVVKNTPGVTQVEDQVTVRK